MVTTYAAALRQLVARHGMTPAEARAWIAAVARLWLNNTAHRS